MDNTTQQITLNNEQLENIKSLIEDIIQSLLRYRSKIARNVFKKFEREIATITKQTSFAKPEFNVVFSCLDAIIILLDSSEVTDLISKYRARILNLLNDFTTHKRI